jgi:hypothetical protein
MAFKYLERKCREEFGPPRRVTQRIAGHAGPIEDKPISKEHQKRVDEILKELDER